MTTFTSFAELAAANAPVDNAPATPVLDLKQVVMGDEIPPSRELTGEEVAFLTSDEFLNEVSKRAWGAARRIKQMQASPSNGFATLASEPDLIDDFKSRVKIIVFAAVKYFGIATPVQWDDPDCLTAFWNQKVPYASRGYVKKEVDCKGYTAEEIRSSKVECTLWRAIGRLCTSMWIQDSCAKRLSRTKYVLPTQLPDDCDVPSLASFELRRVVEDNMEVFDLAIESSRLTRSEKEVMSGLQLGLSAKEIADMIGVSVSAVGYAKHNALGKVAKWFAEGSRKQEAATPHIVSVLTALDIKDEEKRTEALSRLLLHGKGITQSLLGR